MPMSAEFENRLYPVIDDIAAHYGTPFHIYDEAGIHQTAALLKQSFAPAAGFREYFAVKALPNPWILAIMKDMGFGFDCSSVAELMLSRRIGARGEEIMFTSNNTAREDFLEAAREGGCILNLDDISLVPKVPEFPELVCFRYNPGPRRTGNAIIGNPVEAKYGVAHDQIVAAYRQAIGRGAKRFGIHTMLVSNERNHGYMVQTVEMLLELVEAISGALGIRFEFMNMGGGLGIPYRPTDEPLDITALSAEVAVLLERFKTKHGQVPKLYMESGRYISGPHGVLVVRAVNRKDIYRSHIGVDACMSALMRPAMYGSHHDISLLPCNDQQRANVATVVAGPLCESGDVFTQAEGGVVLTRKLPEAQVGDLLVFHDAGAYGASMSSNYNSRLLIPEVLVDGGQHRLVRRRQTLAELIGLELLD
jgi:diaminopimelate decarboxylase